MKKLEVIVKPGKSEAVRKAVEHAGYPGITISQAEGHGSQKGMSREHNGGKYRMELVPKVRVEIVIPDDALDQVVEAITKAACTGMVGDGKIFVSDISDVIRIRTGERGEKAV